MHHLSFSTNHLSDSKNQSTSNFDLSYIKIGVTLTGYQSTIKSKLKPNHPIRTRSRSQSQLESTSNTSINRRISSNHSLIINPIIPSSVIFDRNELYILQNSSLAPVQVPNLSFGSINSTLNYSLTTTTTTNQPINHILNSNQSNWEVKVIITEVDLNQMKLNGIMKAKSNTIKHHSSDLIITSWKGEIIDFVNHFLLTNGTWGITEKVEKEFWSKTKAFINHLDQLDSIEFHQAFQDRIHQDFVLMRWKETHFVNCEPDQSGLSIQGFYFVCQSKSNGSIEAFYYDPSSITLQRLTLNLLGSNGIGFGYMNLA